MNKMKPLREMNPDDVFKHCNEQFTELLYHSLSDPSKHAQFAEEGLGSIVEMYE
jgi:hypothetical protein